LDAMRRAGSPWRREGNASCRFAVEEGRQRRRAVVEVTSRSNGGVRLSGKRGALLPLLQARGRPWRAALEGSVGREVSRRGGAGQAPARGVAAWFGRRRKKGGKRRREKRKRRKGKRKGRKEKGE
jgi:hypothetical protein